MRSTVTIVIASCVVGIVATALGGAALGGERATGRSSAASPITKIELVLKTGNRSDAATDGDVFLGVAGREFNVDSLGDHDDFERNETRTYVFGSGANVPRPSESDPRSPMPIDFSVLSRTPRYIRFEPGSDWDVEKIDVTISAGSTNSLHVGALDGDPHLWLGERRGKILYLR